VHRKTGAPFFIDKMPNNFAHIGLIQLALPNAKIIDARRHPLACCFSGYKQHFRARADFSYGLDDIGRYYRDYVELMAHFDDGAARPHPPRDLRNHGRRHRGRSAAPAGLLRAAVRGTDACVSSRTLARCAPASSEQVRRPIFREGIDQWRHYDAWLGPLKAALGPVLDAYPGIPAFTTGDSST
jgi:hypothetical protein